MSKSGKKLTINMIAAEMQDYDTSEIIVFQGKNNEIKIPVKHRLDFEESMTMVRDIAASCANLEDGTYAPEAFDMSVRLSTLIYYAGIDWSGDVAKAYQVVYETSLFDDVWERIDHNQFNMLVEAAKKKAEFQRDQIISTGASKVNELIEKMNEVMMDSTNLIKQMDSDEFAAQLEELKKLAEAANGGAQSAEHADNIVELPVRGE